jgi:hypothetical protein
MDMSEVRLGDFLGSSLLVGEEEAAALEAVVMNSDANRETKEGTSSSERV